MTTPSPHPLSPLRDLHFMCSPAMRPTWPYLPLVRRSNGALECGLLFDAQAACGLADLETTVFLGNLLRLPATLEQFLAQPREVFASFEEVIAGGWRVD
jgi:hypothetical protein